MLLNKLTNIYLGSQVVKKIYLGDTLVYPPYSEELQAFVQAVQASGYEVPTNLVALDTFINTLKTEDIWSKLDSLYLFRNNTLTDFNSYKIDLINPSRQGTFNGGLVASVTGIKGNGTNAYFGTSFNPAIDGKNYTLNDASRGIFVTTPTTSAIPNVSLTVLDGSADHISANIMLNLNYARQRINQSISNTNQDLDLSGDGLKVLNRVSSTTINAIGKSVLNSRQDVSTNIFDSEQLVLSRGKSSSYYGDARIGLYFMGASITLSESKIIETAYNTYII